jgi:S-adenosylmethionine:tRNA ribosyltransferase-isomerase
MKTEDLNYELPGDLIAQHPTAERTRSRLLVLDRHTTALADKHFGDLVEYLQAGDLLVLNNTKVLPARFFARRVSGALLEGLFIKAIEPDTWEVLLKNARKLKSGEIFLIHPADGTPDLEVTFLQQQSNGHCRIRVYGCTDPASTLNRIGYAPLPPYIKRCADTVQGSRDRERYQTVFAECNGAVAAPTAGLHFTKDLLGTLRRRGVETTTVTLHVGIGTFKPVTAVHLEDHAIHAEEIRIDKACARAVNRAKDQGRRVIAVGTTSTRALESAAVKTATGWRLQATCGSTQLFITPGYEFKIVDALITNFHLPQSTLIALVGALAGLDRIKEAYAHAVRERYRFYSYGDAMFII